MSRCVKSHKQLSIDMKRDQEGTRVSRNIKNSIKTVKSIYTFNCIDDINSIAVVVTREVTNQLTSKVHHIGVPQVDLQALISQVTQKVTYTKICKKALKVTYKMSRMLVSTTTSK